MGRANVGIYRCHIFYSQRVVDIPDGKPKWSKLDGKSELVDEVGYLEQVESVVSKHKLEEADQKNERAEKAAREEGEATNAA